MSSHPIPSRVRGFFEQPNAATLDAVKSGAWREPLWIHGETHDAGEGVLLQMEVQQLEGYERHVLFAYVDEQEARRADGDRVMQYPLGVLASMAHEREIDVALVDGEHVELLSHEQLLALRDLVAMDDAARPLPNKTDLGFLKRLKTFRQRAADYCRAQPDVRTWRLAAMGFGAAPLRAVSLLEASNAAVHAQALHALFKQVCLPGDMLMALDPLQPEHTRYIQVLRQQEPFHVAGQHHGWWARLRRRLSPVVLIQVNIELE